MRRKSLTRLQRYIALGLELCGGAAVVYALTTLSLMAGIALAGVLAILVAQFWGEIL